MPLFERDLSHIYNLNEILSFSKTMENEHHTSEQAIFEQFFSNSNNKEEIVTISNTPSIKEEESNKNIKLLNNKYYPIEEIIKILEKNNIPKNIIDMIRYKDIAFKDIELILNPKKTFIAKKTRRKNEVITETKDIIETKDTKETEPLTCGRNKKDDYTIKKHNKDSSDNIARKIKVFVFKYLIEYCKIHILKELLCLDYRYISDLKKDINLIMLDSPLKEILSLNISSKYRKDIEHNKNIINSILEKETNNEKLKNLLEMKLNDWIDGIFLFKENSENVDKFNGLESTLLYIKDLRYQNDKNYLKRFVFYLYNFRSWFQNKKGRNKNN